MHDSGSQFKGGTGDVAVVGAGVSGLAAAFRIAQAGYTPTVFEATGHPGGRTLSTFHDGFTLDRGAGIMSSNYKHLLGLAEAAGLGHLVVPANGTFGFACADGTTADFGGAHRFMDALRFPLSARSKLTASRLLIDVLRHRRGLLAQDLSLAAHLDWESAGSYARRRLNPELLQGLIDPTVRGLAGSAAEDVSVFDFLVALCKFIGADALAFRDGMGTFAEQLGQRFESEYGARVTSVEQRGGIVDVSWSDADGHPRSDHFAGCVIALPAPRIPPIHSGLDRERADFLAAVRYTTSVSVHVGLSEPPDHLAAACVIFPEAVEPGIMTMVAEHLKAPGRAPAGKGLISLVTDDKEARILTNLDDHTIVSTMLKRAERFVPGITAATEFAEVSRWNEVVLRAGPGHYRGLWDFAGRCRNDSVIQLAGDYFGVASIDVAVVGGERAARALTDHLDHRRAACA